MKLNIDKCCLIVWGYKHENEQVWAQTGEDKIFQSIDVKLLGVTIDKELKFDKHFSKICSKASRKLTVLARMSKFLTFEKRKTIFKTFVELQFNIVHLFGCFVADIWKSIGYMKKHCEWFMIINHLLNNYL